MIQEERPVPPKTPVFQYLPKGLEKRQERERGFGIFEVGGPAAQNRPRHGGVSERTAPLSLVPTRTPKNTFCPWANVHFLSEVITA